MKDEFEIRVEADGPRGLLASNSSLFIGDLIISMGDTEIRSNGIMGLVGLTLLIDGIRKIFETDFNSVTVESPNTSFGITVRRLEGNEICVSHDDVEVQVQNGELVNRVLAEGRRVLELAQSTLGRKDSPILDLTDALAELAAITGNMHRNWDRYDPRST